MADRATDENREDAKDLCEAIAEASSSLSAFAEAYAKLRQIKAYGYENYGDLIDLTERVKFERMRSKCAHRFLKMVLKQFSKRHGGELGKACRTVLSELSGWDGKKIRPRDAARWLIEVRESFQNYFHKP